MMGAGWTSSRSCPIAESPSMPGRRMSRTTASGASCRRQPDPFLRRGGGCHLVAEVAEELAERPADAGLVVDHKDPTHVSVRLDSRGGLWQAEAEPGPGPLATPRQGSMMRLGHLHRQGQPEPHPFRLAGHERVVQGRLDRRRRARARVAHLDGSVAAGLLQVQPTLPPGPAASIALRVRLSTAARRLGSSATASTAAPHGPTASPTSPCSQLGCTSVATSWSSRTRSHGEGRRSSTRPSVSRPADLLLDQRELTQGHGHARVCPGALAPLEVKLQAQPGTGQCVAKLVGRPRRELPSTASVPTGGWSGSSAGAGRTSG